MISLVAWRLLQFSEDYKALAMSGLLARPENRTTPSFFDTYAVRAVFAFTAATCDDQQGEDSREDKGGAF